MEGLTAVGLAAAAAGLSWAGSGAVIRLLRARRILDPPNERSSHDRPTPRGGGIAVVAATLACWGLVTSLGGAAWSLVGPIALVAFGLALVSWADDLRGLSPLPRFAAQLAAVSLALATVPLGPLVPGPLPAWLAYGAAAVAWLWFINLFNFMDGIDGLAGAEALAVAAGVAVVAAVVGMADGTPLLAAPLAGAAGGFLLWNWHPARVFLGDVGSVPVGFLLGWLLLSLAAHGAWAAALILPAYFLADATLTLARRAARGKPVWRAHRDHFYQVAVQAGASHAQVTRAASLANLGLVVCAVASLAGAPARAAALAAALVIVGALLWYLRRGVARGKRLAQ